MRVTIYQPRYFPQLHYFNRMVSADVFVFLDNAQYTKSLRQQTSNGQKRTTSFQSDTPIKLPSGRYLLTIPVHHNGYQALNKTKIDYQQHWPTKHLSVIKNSYQKSAEFAEIYQQLKDLFLAEYLSLASLNCITTLWALSYLLEFPTEVSFLTPENINILLAKQQMIRLKKILFASHLPVPRPDGMQKGTEWTTAICEYIGADEYMHGGTAKENYMDLEYYTAHHITPVQQQWTCTPYQQQFEKITPFIPNLSIIDMLANVDRVQARKIVFS